MSTTLTMSKKEQLWEHISALPHLDLPAKAEAEAAVETLELPGTKTEAWKYTRVGKIANQQYQGPRSSDSSAAVAASSIDFEKAYTLVFVDGFFDVSQSDYEGANFTVRELSVALEDDHIQEHVAKYSKSDDSVFNAMNTARPTGGCCIEIAANTKGDAPVHIIDILSSDATIAQPRHLIVADRGSELHVVQSYYSQGSKDSFRNAITEVLVAENASVTIDKIQNDGDTRSVITEQVEQAADSRFAINTITVDGLFVRNNLNIRVNGSNCYTHLYGLYLLKNKQHVDNHTMVDHRVPHCDSNELYKGLIDEEATAVFNGKVFVREDAQKTNAFQSNANILLSDSATINSKPELEIYADDVKCSHGSTTGQFDEEAVFYLRSRGLSEKSARELLVAGFAADVLEGISSEPVREKVNSLLAARFGWDID